MEKNLYPKESAGKVMVLKEKVPFFSQEKKISEIKELFLTNLKDYEVCYYIYFLDKEERLVGILSERELFNAPLNIQAKEIINSNIIKVIDNFDQEKVAILAILHQLKAIPVVDKENKFLGVVPARVIFQILHYENIEDFLKAAGIHSLPNQALTGSVPFLIRVRLPWLILGFFGGLIAAKLTEFFETPLKKYFILAAFIPLIVYIADAIGTQTETLLVRNLVIKKINFKKYFLKELKVGLGISFILGILLFLISFIWSKKIFIGLILGLSMFFTGMTAIFIPVLIVLLLEKYKKDPAIASGPFATILQDVISLIIYFSIASILIKIFT